MFVGRDEVTGCLGTALKHAANGRGSALVISGDDGIGKTRVTRETLAEIQPTQRVPYVVCRLAS